MAHTLLMPGQPLVHWWALMTSEVMEQTQVTKIPVYAAGALFGILALAASAVLVAQSSVDPLVFVSRRIPPNGSMYYPSGADMPGVGTRSRFRVASPGKLLIRESDGNIRVLIDGANPTAASLNLIDVNAPDVSYDGTRIVFAGLPNGTYGGGPNGNPGAWRIYTINVDGTGLRQVTRSDQSLDLSQFGSAAGGLRAYDDTDPVWLPDGRIAFSSTRWPSYSQYSGARASNLYVVNADGTVLRRITAERNGADRPAVDPVTGKIVYSRWWRNQRFALNDESTVSDPNGGYIQKDGLTADRNTQLTGESRYRDFLFRNVWNPAEINPDGTGLAAWGGSFLHTGDGNGGHIYGGAFSPSGELFANFFPMFNMTEASGFGGIRRFSRGPQPYVPVVGITALGGTLVSTDPPSYGVYVGDYAGEPEVLPDGTIVISWAANTSQDYGLYRVNANGSGLTLLYDAPGTTELRARAVRARPLPPIVPDTVTQVPSLLPPPANGPYDQDGTFVFDALNVYANAPVDVDIVSAPAVGSAATIRFFIDHQRTSPGSFPNLDWPIRIGELPVAPNGAVRDEAAPANVPLFEQLRSRDGTVPITRSPTREQGAAHVAGMNFGRPGTVARCMGCHIGHTMIPVPTNPADAEWTNMAPGAALTVSSTRDATQNGGLTDRRVMKGEMRRYWTSASGQYTNQWVLLAFPAPIDVRAVRLYNPRQGGEANSSVQVLATRVEVCADVACNAVTASNGSGALDVSGTSVPFADIRNARAVRVHITDVTGTFYGARVAGLAEVEVIARGAGGTQTGLPTAPTNLRIIVP